MQAPALKTPITSSRSSEGIEDPMTAAVVDATVLTLSSYDKLMKVADLKKVRAMLEREVDRASDGDGFVHLTPLFVYLWSAAKPWYATGDVMACVREVSTALQQRGVKARLPDAYRFPGKERTEADRAGLPRAPVGTRAGDRRRRTPRPVRDV